jgi:hypothetical protein
VYGIRPHQTDGETIVRAEAECSVSGNAVTIASTGARADDVTAEQTQLGELRKQLYAANGRLAQRARTWGEMTKPKWQTAERHGETWHDYGPTRETARRLYLAYPKSQALELHSDAIQVEVTGWHPPSDGGPRVLFRPFSGVAPCFVPVADLARVLRVSRARFNACVEGLRDERLARCREVLADIRKAEGL